MRPRHVSFVHAHLPAAHKKYSLPVPFGQPQLTVVQALVTLPQALPSAGVGHVAGAQHTFGFGIALHAWPEGQPHCSVPPHRSG